MELLKLNAEVSIRRRLQEDEAEEKVLIGFDPECAFRSRVDLIGLKGFWIQDLNDAFGWFWFYLPGNKIPQSILLRNPIFKPLSKADIKKAIISTVLSIIKDADISVGEKVGEKLNKIQALLMKL